MSTFLVVLIAVAFAGGVVGAGLGLWSGALPSFLAGAGVAGPVGVLCGCVVGGFWHRPRWFVIALTVLSFGPFSALLFWAFASPPEGVMIFNPNVDTRFAQDFTEHSFEQAALGMSSNEVVDLLGQPLRVSQYDRDNSWPGKPSEVWFYTGDGACSWGDFAWKGRAICFHSNRVVGKWSTWCYD